MVHNLAFNILIIRSISYFILNNFLQYNTATEAFIYPLPNQNFWPIHVYLHDIHDIAKHIINYLVFTTSKWFYGNGSTFVVVAQMIVVIHHLFFSVESYSRTMTQTFTATQQIHVVLYSCCAGQIFKISCLILLNKLTITLSGSCITLHLPALGSETHYAGAKSPDAHAAPIFIGADIAPDLNFASRL
jgi:hypothetical protein